MGEQKIGTVSHYYGHISVAAVKVTEGELRVGDTVHIKGHTSDFKQTVESIQIEHEEVEVAKAGDQVGITVTEHARVHDDVFKVTGE